MDSALKKCAECKVKRRRNKKCSRCKDCDNKKRRDYYWNNRKKALSYRKKNQHKNTYFQRFNKTERKLQLFIEFGEKCADCGGSFPMCVMDFDHLENKKYKISLILGGKWSIIAKEISKCEMVCANCHRIRTWHV